jgi:hypothetical protein
MHERKEIVVAKTHGDAHEREHPLVAIREAFDEAIRQIGDAAREMRGGRFEEAQCKEAFVRIGCALVSVRAFFGASDE